MEVAPRGALEIGSAGQKSVCTSDIANFLRHGNSTAEVSCRNDPAPRSQTRTTHSDQDMEACDPPFGPEALLGVRCRDDKNCDNSRTCRANYFSPNSQRSAKAGTVTAPKRIRIA